jgi:hypothetical protein
MVGICISSGAQARSRASEPQRRSEILNSCEGSDSNPNGTKTTSVVVYKKIEATWHPPSKPGRAWAKSAATIITVVASIEVKHVNCIAPMRLKVTKAISWQVMRPAWQNEDITTAHMPATCCSIVFMSGNETICDPWIGTLLSAAPMKTTAIDIAMGKFIRSWKEA